jgi:hypothetical protein
MGGVEHDGAIGGDNVLEPAGPLRSCKSSTNGTLIDADARAIYDMECRQGGAGVLNLVWSRDSN